MKNSKIEFVRNKETGELIVYKDGRPQGKMITMGDVIEDRPVLDDGKKEKERSENG